MLPVRVIYLTKDKSVFTIFDPEDFEFVSRFQWYAKIHRWLPTVKGYAFCSINKKHQFMQWLLMESKGIDHVNGNGFDNRRINLRKATDSQQLRNRKTWAKSGFKGVTVSYNGWSATVSRFGKAGYYGTFSTKEEAARVVDDITRRYYGSDGTYNFPRTGERPAR